MSGKAGRVDAYGLWTARWWAGAGRPKLGIWLAAVLLAAAGMTGLAVAGPLYWSGAGTWDNGTTASWGTVSGGPYASVWSSDSGANFEGVSGTVNVSGTISSVDSITFATDNYTLSGGTITLSGSGAITTGAGTDTINSVLAGAAMTKYGSGTLYVSAANTFTGGATLAAGTLKFNSVGSNALGTGPFTIQSGTTLSVGGNNIQTLNNSQYNLNGDFSVVSSGGNALNFATGNASMNASRTVTVTGLTLNVNGAISETAAGYGLTKDGTGTLALKGASTFTGKTSILAGTLSVTALPMTDEGVAGPLGMPTGANAVIDINNGAGLQTGSTSPRVNQSTNRTINLAGTGPGTVSLRVNDNDTVFTFNSVTATGTGAKTLALYTGASGNGDREELTFNGSIPNVSDGSPLSLQVTFTTQSGSSTSVNLVSGGTFTGPITLVRGANVSWGYLVIGGRLGRTSTNNSFANTVGTGQLNGGNYAAAISLDTNTILYYDSTANQTLSGLISGAGALTAGGTGTLSLPNANTFSGQTTLAGGVLELGGNLALQNSALNVGTVGSVTLSGPTTATFGGLAGSRSLDTVITSGYGGVTALTLNPVAGASNTYSGAIADGAAGMTVTKTGLGTQVLSGASTYTGATTINAGTLQLGTGTAGQNGSLASASIVDNALLVFNNADAQTCSGNISGTGALTKTGAGTLALSGTNTYAAGTLVNAGILQYDVLGAIAGSGRSVTVTGPGAVALGYAGSLQSDLLSRVATSSTGALALTSAVNLAENLDFRSL